MRALAAALLFAAACTGSASDPDNEPSPTEAVAESGLTLVTNAAVYTVDEEQPWAEAFVVDADGVIVFVGDAAAAEGFVGERGGPGATIDAEGRLVLPGFQDAHVHVPEAGLNTSMCLVDPGLDLAEYEEQLGWCADEQGQLGQPGQGEDDWVRVAGASLFGLRDTDESPLDVIDRVFPDQPVVVLDDLGHAAWTNSLGLAAAGIGEDDPDPQGGVLHRDREGRLTGLLLEDAQQLVRNVSAPSAEVIDEGLSLAMGELARNGVTTVSDAGGYWLQGHDDAWQRAADAGRLTVRAANTLYVYPSLDVETQLSEFRARFSDDPGSMLRVNTAKVYIDGILDLGTALLSEDYLEPPDPRFPSGFTYFDKPTLDLYAAALHHLGYRLNFHVIGDEATQWALDAVTSIDAPADEVADRRHRTTHTYMVAPEDIARFAELGVVADFQVGPESSDVEYHAALAEFVGEQAWDLLPQRTLLDAGASVILSSDWDADPLSPLGIIERALTRETEALATVEDAVAALTIDAAYALGHDWDTGSITPGKWADWVMLDRNIFELDPSAIGETEVLMTVVGGRVVFDGR